MKWASGFGLWAKGQRLRTTDGRCHAGAPSIALAVFRVNARSGISRRVYFRYLARISRTRSIGMASAVREVPVTVVARSSELYTASSVASSTA